MRLFYTSNSPYARIARVAALELNLSNRIDMQKVVVRNPNSILLNYNPTSKVPTLVTDDQFILSETRIICVYLNHFNNEIKLVDRAVPWAYIDADLPSFPGNRTVIETKDAQPTVLEDRQKQ